MATRTSTVLEKREREPTPFPMMRTLWSASEAVLAAIRPEMPIPIMITSKCNDFILIVINHVSRNNSFGKIPNPNIQIPNKSQISISKSSNHPNGAVLNFGFCDSILFGGWNLGFGISSVNHTF
jgi:hypothetical protein